MKSTQQPGTLLCSDGCGRPATRKGPDAAPDLSEACYRRWMRAGCPPDGPPPPTIYHPRRAAPVTVKPVAPASDLAEARWARERLESEPQRRVERLIGLACALAQTVQARDNAGKESVLEKIRRLTDTDREVVMLLLADCSDPWCLYDRTELAGRAGRVA